MVYLSVLAGPSQICAKMVYSNRVSITSFQVKDMGVGGQTLFWRSPLSRWHLYVIYPGLNRNDWKSMRWGEEEQEENVACCRYPGVLSEPWESSQGTAQGYLPGWTVASAQLTVPGRASLLNRDGGYPCSATTLQCRFWNLNCLKGLMDVFECIFPSFSALAVRDESSPVAL